MKIKLATGGGSVLNDVSLITGGVEALGHGIYIDEKSVETVITLLLGKPLRSYLSHFNAFKDRIGTEIGFFSGIYRDGLKVRAKTFEFLDAFKRHDAPIHDRIYELATKYPDQIGVSVVANIDRVWVLDNGAEVPFIDEVPPANAIRDIPSARFTSIDSADLVSFPAANPDGLLSVKQVDEVGLGEMETKTDNQNTATVVCSINASGAVGSGHVSCEKTAVVAMSEASADTAQPETLEAIKPAEENKEADKLESLSKEAACIKSELDALTARKAALEEALEKRDKDFQALLSSAGIQVNKLDAEELKQVVETAICKAARKMLAKVGISPLAENPEGEQATAEKSESLSPLARVQKQFRDQLNRKLTK